MPETQFALRNQFRILAPGGDDAGIDLVRRERFGSLNAEIGGKRAEFGLGQTELRHARFFFCFVTIDGDVAVFVEDGARLFQPLVNPFARHFRADVREVGTQHRGTFDPREAVTALTIQFGEELAAARELRRLGQVSIMTRAAGRLNKASRQDRLFPGKSRFVRFGDFRGRALAPMANGAAPVANIVGNRRMRAEGLRHRTI